MSLIDMSLSGAIMIVVIVVIRALAIHHLPKKVFVVLWGVVLVRLLVPYSLPSRFSVYSAVQPLSVTQSGANPAAAISSPADEAAKAESPAAPSTAAAPSLTPAAVSASSLPFNGWTAVWLAGALLFAVCFAAAYFRCRREFRESLPVDNAFTKNWLCAHRFRRPVSIRQSDRIGTPLTYGVIRPVILLPKSIDWADESALNCVLAHEAVHIRHFDAVVKLVLAAAVCIHWFNPAVWVMYVLANRDLELVCDEAVVRQLGEDTKVAYAMTLIHMEEVKGGMRPLCSNFSKTAIEERIVAIMKIKKTSIAALTAAVTLVAGVTTAFATSPEPSQRKGRAYTEESQTETPDVSDEKWWTAEEYAAWLEEEKEEMAEVIGAKGWAPDKGWFTWDQEMVNETIAQYEETLERIKNGAKIAKPLEEAENTIWGQEIKAVDTVVQPQTVPEPEMVSEPETVPESETAPEPETVSPIAGEVSAPSAGQSMQYGWCNDYENHGYGCYPESSGHHGGHSSGRHH